MTDAAPLQRQPPHHVHLTDNASCRRDVHVASACGVHVSRERDAHVADRNRAALAPRLTPARCRSLAIPYMNYSSPRATVELYRNTRKFVLSGRDPWCVPTGTPKPRLWRSCNRA
jgi:hypothetical protein